MAGFCGAFVCKAIGDARTATLEQDLLCKSPGIPGDHPLVVQALERGILIWTDANLTYHFAKAPIIAITGTNGKTTTTLMVKHLLESAGKRVFCGGNIGTPCSDVMVDSRPYDVYLWELSELSVGVLPRLEGQTTPRS